MNFVVASLLYHAEEPVAFWLYVSLIEDCEIRDIYLPGLPGLYKHTQIIEILIQENLPEIFYHFRAHQIKVEMYASDWLFGLFASVIPLEKMKTFFNLFFKFKWVFFYKMVLSILKKLEHDILAESELWDILNSIK